MNCFFKNLILMWDMCMPDLYFKIDQMKLNRLLITNFQYPHFQVKMSKGLELIFIYVI